MVAYDDVAAAAARLAGQANPTPVLTSRTLDEWLGAEIFFKCENFQRVGAFKFRGAYNAISALDDAERARGVLTFSSGNHAQAVALVAQIFGIDATIIMPDNAPASKRRATEGYGARVVEYAPDETTREALAGEMAADTGATVIPPYDHPLIIAGQGTAALELFEEVPGLEALLVPCGGGGLLSGCALAASGAAPDCRVIGIEPELADDATQSFRTGQLVTVHNPPTIADGTRTPSLGTLTFPLVLQYVDDMQTVSEDAIYDAVRFFFYRMKLVVEPSGALGLAALLGGTVQPGARVGVIISGGNIDAQTFGHILGLG
ncbi:MAG: threo-3-hydroxy-L-aspartate ammonia-lyase [Anaerolineales bacterium]